MWELEQIWEGKVHLPVASYLSVCVAFVRSEKCFFIQITTAVGMQLLEPKKIILWTAGVCRAKEREQSSNSERKFFVRQLNDRKFIRFR